MLFPFAISGGMALSATTVALYVAGRALGLFAIALILGYRIDSFSAGPLILLLLELLKSGGLVRLNAFAGVGFVVLSRQLKTQ